MKKILLISMILASGCIAPKTPDPTPIPSKEPTIAPTSTPIPTPTPTAEAKKEFIFGETPAIFSNNFWPYLQEQTWEVGLPYPTSTDVFFGEDHDNIGFAFQYGEYASENDPNLEALTKEVESLPQDSSGNPYFYYGKLTKITDTVYAAKGSYVSFWDVKKVSPDVDFYIIYEEPDKIYYCFKDLPIEEVETYRYHPEAYAEFAVIRE